MTQKFPNKPDIPNRRLPQIENQDSIKNSYGSGYYSWLKTTLHVLTDRLNKRGKQELANLVKSYLIVGIDSPRNRAPTNVTSPFERFKPRLEVGKREKGGFLSSMPIRQSKVQDFTSKGFFSNMHEYDPTGKPVLRFEKGAGLNPHEGKY